MTASRSPLSRLRTRTATALAAVGVSLGLIVTGTATAPPVQAENQAGSPQSWTAQGKPFTTDLPGGKSVVGQTSPIHDPALIIDDDGTWYVYSTGLVNRENGGTIQIWTSHDEGTTWEYTGTVWDRIPAWIDEHFSDGALPGNLWAPEIHENDGTFYLYYSASRFGGNNSLTALATNTTLDPEDPDYEWVDQGLVVSSPVTGLDPNNSGKTFNAIDAGIVEGEDGKPYMAIGSFWYGIFLVPIEWPSGKPVQNWQSQTVDIADRFMPGNPIEAPYIMKKGDYYYLFVSFDSCCRGGDSTYKIAVGRSKSVKGPYLDKEGRDMFGGGGTVVFDAHGAITGPGGQSVFGDYLAFHYYDGANEGIPFFPTLGLQKINWVDGWPDFNQTVDVPATTIAPKPAAAVVGGKATFRAEASGTPAPVAKWETSADDGATWQRVEDQPQTLNARDGLRRSQLTLKHLATEQDGLLVRAVFSNAHGTSVTGPVELTVRTPGAARR
ncbi:arabinan endo-1,5-alpha-L-arabinosidase [Arthrobacter pigmenti]|uniref:Arabinan endo-1,5-alpha-L-arabinosidase n=1 Tax=Arthrobacter pigmenti TaxID=271432 RepID=A0A846RM53_9MICC|nr:arabinan endo-1,5-alpha-L-arabinosidase [Arthrobacter pigmenti]NJC21384.1 arabinan endo-1,5-alpha-L-arabinosidase [Arthrobacter pigmenti]